MLKSENWLESKINTICQVHIPGTLVKNVCFLTYQDQNCLTWIDPELDPVAGELQENDPKEALLGRRDESESDGTSMLTSGGRWWIE